VFRGGDRILLDSTLVVRRFWVALPISKALFWSSSELERLGFGAEGEVAAVQRGYRGEVDEFGLLRWMRPRD